MVLWSALPQALSSGDGSWLVVSTTSAPLLWRWTFVSPLTTSFTFTFENGHDVYFCFKCLMLRIILDNALSPDSKAYCISRFPLTCCICDFWVNKHLTEKCNVSLFWSMVSDLFQSILMGKAWLGNGPAFDGVAVWRRLLSPPRGLQSELVPGFSLQRPIHSS